MPQYKANLHSHSTLSDGRLTPEELAGAYRKKGYSVLAITDHEATYDHSDLSTPDFLLLTGYEAYIRPSKTCAYDFYAPEIHLNLFAKDPHNTTFICYDPYYCKYMPHEIAETRRNAGPTGTRQYSVEYINQFIRIAKENGYIVSYNHPCWSMEAESDILSYEGIFSLEVYNTGATMDNGIESNMSLFDKLNRKGKTIYCHGADDNHNKHPFDDVLNDSFKAWTMIIADKLTYESVIEALETGKFYASTGPTIHKITIKNRRIDVKCSPARRILFHISPKKAFSI